MEIPGVNRSVPIGSEAQQTIPADRAAQNREVIQAVKALNQSEMYGPENQLTFQRDPRVQRMVVRIVNQKTQEVVAQIPEEYILERAADLKSEETIF